MKPSIVVDQTCNPQIVDFHLGFNIAKDEAKIFAEVQDGEIKETPADSFEKLNLRGGFLLGRISGFKGVKRIAIDQDSLGIEVEEGFNIPEIVNKVVTNIIFVIPPRIQHRATVFVDRTYHILNSYNQSRE